MQLANARALKSQLKAAHHAAIVAEAATPAIAVGIAPGAAPLDYKLAIRVRSEAALAHPHVATMTDAANGEVDVRVTGLITPRPAAPLAAQKRIAIGESIGHFGITAGTLGFFAKNAAGKIGIVSNNHVLANEDAGADGDHILQPGPIDSGTDPADLVARLLAPYPKLHPGVKNVDCAFALLEDGIAFTAGDLGGGNRLTSHVIDATDGLHVSKIGRTTGRTSGSITAFELDGVVVQYGFGEVTFNEQVEIDSRDVAPFSEAGDSGSLIFDDDCNPVALLFAGSESGGELGSGLTYANHFSLVLEALGVTLLT